MWFTSGLALELVIPGSLTRSLGIRATTPAMRESESKLFKKRGNGVE